MTNELSNNHDHVESDNTENANEENTNTEKNLDNPGAENFFGGAEEPVVPTTINETAEEEIAEATVEVSAEESEPENIPKVQAEPETVATEQVAEITAEVVAEPETEPIVAEAPAEITDVKEELKAGAQEELQEAEDDHGLQEDNELEGMDRKLLLKIISEAIHFPENKKINTRVMSAKAEITRQMDDEKLRAKEKFLSDPDNEETDFEFHPDQSFKAFNDAFKLYKTKRSEYITDQIKKRDFNFKLKKELLARLKVLIEGKETQESLQEIRVIQDEWKKIGQVPQTEAEKLWTSYQFYINKFYDQFSLYSEFKDLDRKRNMEAKWEMVNRVEALANTESVVEALNLLHQYQDEWKHIGPVPKEMLEEVGLKYKEAMQKVYDRRDAHNADIKLRQEENFAAKMEIVARIAEIASFNYVKANEWMDKNKQIISWMEKWRDIGAVPREKRQELKDALSVELKNFNKGKNLFFKHKKQEQVDNLTKKVKLCEKVEALITEADPNSLRKTVLQHQDEWKKIGPVPQRYSDKTWKRFQKACDDFFAKINEQFKDKEKELLENLQKKNELCEKLEAVVQTDEISDVENSIRNAQAEWDAIGHVPFKEKDAIWKRYYKALNALAAKNKKAARSAELLSYKIMLEGWKGDRDAKVKIDGERNRLQRELKKYETEIGTLENNMEYLSKSNTAEQLKRSMEKEIDKIKIKTEELKEKIKTIKQIDTMQ